MSSQYITIDGQIVNIDAIATIYKVCRTANNSPTSNAIDKCWIAVKSADLETIAFSKESTEKNIDKRLHTLEKHLNSRVI